MAHKKGVGSTNNGRDSESKRLGVKIYGGQFAEAGNILVRQRGTKYHPGEGVGLGKDYTIYALVEGMVSFRKRKNNRTYISVIPVGGEPEVAAKPASKPKKEAAPAPVEAAGEEAPVAAAPAPEKPKAKKAVKGDDLRKIEGIGPKIAELLSAAGLDSFEAVAGSTPEKIREILLEAGSRYAAHDPATWPKQAEFAAKGEWDELKAWQDELKGGRES